MVYRIRTKEKGVIECEFDSVEQMFAAVESEGLTVIEYWRK